MVQNIFDEMASEWKYYICSESHSHILIFLDLSLEASLLRFQKLPAVEDESELFMEPRVKWLRLMMMMIVLCTPG